MPTLQIDQSALVCISALIFLILALALWSIHVLNASLNRAFREKAGDLEIQHTTEKAAVVTSPALDEEPGSWPESPFRPEEGDKKLPDPAFVSVSTHEFEYVAFKEISEAGQGTD